MQSGREDVINLPRWARANGRDELRVVWPGGQAASCPYWRPEAVYDTWAGEIVQGSFLPRADQKRYEELVEDLNQHYRNTESRDLVEVEKRLKHLDAF